MEKKQLSPDYIFEVSWEVCHLVGGIYTVLSTKAKTLQKQYKDKVIFIGPDLWKTKESPYFTELPQSFMEEWRTQAKERDGLDIRIGRWNVPGNPLVVLVDYHRFYDRKNQLFGDMWQWYGVDSLPAYGDYDESCVFAYASALVIESFYRFIGGEKWNVIAHFDEWTTGMGLLYIKNRLPRVATLFTTHATSIGRSIAGNHKPLYDYMDGYNGDQMAYELNMVSKHSLEKRAVLHADCFTTVSEITARECLQLLERQPDVVTPNGFEKNFVPKGEAAKQKRAEARRALLATASALVGYEPSDDVFLVATSGRYEYKNKGIDLYIDALRRLRDREDLHREVIAFVLVPAWTAGPRADLKQRLEAGTPFDSPLPDPILTHLLHNYDQDNAVRQLHAAGFRNRPGDKVKVIFVPSYLTGADGIFDCSYYDLLIGFDMTAFPSYYEPWGYTPTESIAFGVPTVTTDLSGFGKWVQSVAVTEQERLAATVLHRTDSDFDEVADRLARHIVVLSQLTDREKTAVNRAAVSLAAQADWNHFIVYYRQAFDIALRKKRKQNNRNTTKL